MALFILVPDNTTGTNNWSCSTGSDFVDLVDEDDDTTYIHETALNHEINYTFANPLFTEATIDFDEDVTVSAFVHAHYTNATGSVTLSMDTNGTDITLPAVTQAVDNSTYPAYAGSSTTAKAFGSDWDYAGLQNLQMKIVCASRPRRFQYIRVSYVFFKVDYTAAAVAVTDNATFFGANF